MKKILITGASGFVGSFLVKEALNRGLETYAGIRSTSKTDLIRDPRLHLTVIDFEDPKGLSKILEEGQFDYIIQNAGVTRALTEADYIRVNSEYSTLLAQSALNSGYPIEKFIYISSIESHGSADQTSDGVVDANTQPQPRTTYGKSKLHAERALQQISELPLVILRPTAVFGPGERDIFTIFETIKKFRLSPIIGTSKIKYSFIYVKDLVRVTLDALLSDHVAKSYFVSDGRIHNIRQFTGAIARAYKVKPLNFTIPYLVVDTIAAVTSVTDKMTGSKSLVNREQVAKMKARNWDCDIAPIVNDLGFQPQYSLEEAIKETAEWYLKEGWL